MFRSIMRMLVIVLGATVLGGLAGFVFGDRFALSVAADNPCFALRAGERLEHLDPVKRTALIEAVLAAPDLDAETKNIMQHVKKGCE